MTEPAESPCHGATTTHDGINRDLVHLCYLCARRGHLNGATPIQPACVAAKDECVNFVDSTKGSK